MAMEQWESYLAGELRDKQPVPAVRAVKALSEGPVRRLDEPPAPRRGQQAISVHSKGFG